MARTCKMSLPSLQTMCADAYLDALGERPDLIQQIVGERLIERLEKTMRREIRREERKAAYASMKGEIESDLADLVPSLLADLIETEREAIVLRNFYDVYKSVNKETLECAWNIGVAALRIIRTELFFPRP